MSQLVLKDVAESNEIAVCIDKALTDVCEVCNIHKDLVMSRSRSEDVVIARFFLYTILRNVGFTWTHIGQVTKRDHGAAYMGAKRLEGRLLCNEKVLIMMRDSLIARGWHFGARFFYDY